MPSKKNPREESVEVMARKIPKANERRPIKSTNSHRPVCIKKMPGESDRVGSLPKPIPKRPESKPRMQFDVVTLELRPRVILRLRVS